MHKMVKKIEKTESQQVSSEVSRIRGIKKINSLVLVIIILILIFVVIFLKGAVSKGKAGNKVLEVVNNYLIKEGSATLVSVQQESGLYKVNLLYLGQTIPIYITKDNKYLVMPNGIIEIAQLKETAKSASQQSQEEKIEISIDDDAIKGNKNATVTIVEFSDYECPFCGKHFKETLPQIINEYVNAGKVRIVFRDFPLSFHKSAQKAAEAAECAGEQEKYWDMHDKLFNNQDSLGIENLKQYAKDLGLDITKFNDCLDSGKMTSEVQKDMADGQRYGVSGTPAFFINGIKLVGAQPFSEFKRIIDTELNK